MKSVFGFCFLILSLPTKTPHLPTLSLSLIPHCSLPLPSVPPHPSHLSLSLSPHFHCFSAAFLSLSSFLFLRFRFSHLSHFSHPNHLCKFLAFKTHGKINSCCILRFKPLGQYPFFWCYSLFSSAIPVSLSHSRGTQPLDFVCCCRSAGWICYLPRSTAVYWSLCSSFFGESVYKLGSRYMLKIYKEGLPKIT